MDLMHKLESTAHGTVPGFGAIFMSNGTTMKEGLKRGLFGLPSWLGTFVSQVKTGMFLFLFEYEKRLLYGVFQATSDGAMNIVPHAYISSGKQFPAQVRFSILWRCSPLSEDQFRDAIQENYFSAKKFNLGLSGEQVHRLLSLYKLTKCSDSLHQRQLRNDHFEHLSDFFIGGQHMADNDRSVFNGRVRGDEDKDQINAVQESDPLPHHNLKNITHSEYLTNFYHMDNSCLAYNTGSKSNVEFTRPILYHESNYITSMPFRTNEYSETIDKPSETQNQITLPVYEPNLHSLPAAQEFENDGSLRFVDASVYPSHELKYSHPPACSPDQNKQSISRHDNTNTYYMYVPVKEELTKQLTFDSVKLPTVRSPEQTSVNHGSQYVENFGCVYPDCGSRGSVFSRLAYPSNVSSVQKFVDHNENEENYFDSTTNGVISCLHQNRRKLAKTNHKVPKQGLKGGRSSAKKKRINSSNSHSDCFKMFDELGMDIEDNIEGNSSQIALGTPFVDFKRRNNTFKIDDGTNIKNVQLSRGEHKRRKLIRPSFAKYDSTDCRLIDDNVSSALVSKENQNLGQGAGCHSSIENHVTEKLTQNVELPDTIWLVNNGGSSSENVETKTYLESSSRSEDGKISSEVNAKNSIIKADTKDNKCNEKEGITGSLEIIDEPHQAMKNTSKKRSSPMDSASEGVVEEYIQN